MLGHMRQMHVDEVHLAGIDLGAADRVGLEGQALLERVGRGQRAVHLGRGGGAGPDADLERPARSVLGARARGQGLGKKLGVTRAGEPAHADIGARRHQLGRRFGAHDQGVEIAIPYAVNQGHLQTPQKSATACLLQFGCGGLRAGC
ncbi:hypothetical protein D3C71_1752400 [compost metagenome]